MNYSDSYAFCCSLGMQLLSLDSEEELTCLTTLNDSIKDYFNSLDAFYFKIDTIFLFVTDDMKFTDGYFYTSASSQNCINRYAFCPDNGVVIERNDTRW